MNSSDSFDINPSESKATESSHVITSLIYQEKESEDTQLCAELIFQSCKCLKLSITAAGTAIAYLYKLLEYRRESELSGTYLLSGIPAIIYLACKTTEELKPIRDIFNVVYVLRVGNDDPQNLCQLYSNAKRDIILLEHELIRILQFQFDVELPYPYILNIARFMELPRQVVQIAMNLVNEGLIYSNQWLSFPPASLAVVSLYCSLRILSKHAIIDPEIDICTRRWATDEGWWRKWETTDIQLQEIADYLLNPRLLTATASDEG